jgi:cytochrome c oxidase subunit 3
MSEAGGLEVLESDEVIESTWGGGVSPFAVGWSKLFMWLFIITDALLFIGFLASYGFARVTSAAWPDRGQVFHMEFITVMTFTLISSSATMASAVAASQRGNRGAALRWVGLTILGGAAFLGMQAYEWSSLIAEGATIDANPWGAPLFSSYFFLITGFHGSHVLTGLIVLAATAVRLLMGRSRAGGVEIAGLYWHFVDLVWVLIFTLFYLI